MQRSNDTIALIATPLGEGGIGVVQVSGPQALEMTSKLFRSKRAASAPSPTEIDLTEALSGSLFYGTIHDSEGLIDEVLVSIWRANGSSTGEGLVEINCHGGIMAVRKTLEAFLKMGAREGSGEELLDRAVPFAPGGTLQEKEGLDFIQKEALLLLPRARTRLSVKMLLSQYQSAPGGLSHEVRKLGEEAKRIKEKLMGCDTPGVASAFHLLLSSLTALVNSSPFGLALVNPLKVTIAGAPNVGKSTLFNALLREDRVLVHHEPGTTRDYISEFISIEGIPIELIDTAGLREADGVERVGIEWARALHQEADKVILVLDASRPITKEEMEFIKTLVDTKVETSKRVATQAPSPLPALERSEGMGEGRVGVSTTLPLPPPLKGGGNQRPYKQPQVIPVLNKVDLGIRLDWTDLKVCPYMPPPCNVSALSGKGLDGLRRMLIKESLPEIERDPHRPIVFTQRQKGLLEEALNVARELPEDIKDCFTASEVCQKLDQLEKLLLGVLKE